MSTDDQICVDSHTGITVTKNQQDLKTKILLLVRWLKFGKLSDETQIETVQKDNFLNKAHLGLSPLERWLKTGSLSLKIVDRNKCL